MTVEIRSDPAEGRVVDLDGVCAGILAAAESGGTRVDQVFALLARAFAAPYALVAMRVGGAVVEHDWHEGPAGPGFWRDAVQARLEDALAEGRATIRRYTAREGDARVAIVAVPVRRGTNVVGAFAAALSGRSEETLRRQCAEVRALVALAGQVTGGGGSRSDGTPGTSGATLDALRRAGDVRTGHELAYSLTNNLCSHLGCDQVAFGLVRRRTVRILSISGFDDVRSRNPGVRTMTAAMEEAMDRQRPIVSQPGEWEDEAIATGHRLNRRWSESAGGAAVATIPLRHGDRVAAVLALRAAPGRSFTREQIDTVEQQVTPFVAAMLLVDRASRGVLTHSGQAIAATMRSTLGAGGAGRRITAVAALGFVAWFMLGTLPMRVTVPCRVTPAESRLVVAPWEGVIDSAAVVAGDEVRRGDVLCTFDVTMLGIERDRLSAEARVLEIREDEAIASGRLVAAQLARAERGVLDARQAAVDARIARGRRAAPCDGVVLEGDLRRHEGQLVAAGELLFTVASRDGWIVELDVPESHLDLVTAGMTGQFSCNARPEVRQSCRVVRVRPAAEPRDGVNAFPAEAGIDQPAPWMRAGMEGVAKLDTGRRPVWRVVLGGVIDRLHGMLWL